MTAGVVKPAGINQPPLHAGQTYTLTHGARSPRVYDEVAKELFAGLIEDRPDLAAYPEAVASWATLEAQAMCMRRHFAEVGSVDPETMKPRTELSWLSHFEKKAAEARKPLGLDPLSEASLARDRAAATALAVDLAGIAAKGRESLAAQRAAGVEEPPDVVGEVIARLHSEDQERRRQAELEWLL